MQYYKMFLFNLIIMITCAYLFNLAFKYIFHRSTWKVKQAVLVGIFIVAGWLTMFFGVRVDGFAVFDLRALPIIFGTLFFRDPRLLLVIGLGIALSRYTITGLTSTAVTGSINIMMLSGLAALLVILYRRKLWGFKVKAMISIVSIITLQVLGIALFGAVPTPIYLNEVIPFTYPGALLISSFFVFVIRDFHMEQLRGEKLNHVNIILRRQTHELRKAKRVLEKQANELRMASTYKTEFIANISHELKTPLNSIIALSQLLQENEGEKDQEEDIRYANIIHTSGNQLLLMIEDILDISKVEAGKMEIEWETVSVEEMIELLQHQFQPIVALKGLRFDVVIESGVTPSLITDIHRVSQILRNLLMNAVKFTEKGSISLNVQMDPGLQSSSWIVFTVSDTGIGIETDKQQLIFEPFQQEDGSITRRYGGTGLGLSISLGLAERLGGTLTLQSVKGEGSQFVLRLPVHPQFEQASVRQKLI